jgi:Phosphoenolpyruvate carboxylase (EC 4.1.1.31)
MSLGSAGRLPQWSLRTLRPWINLGLTPLQGFEHRKHSLLVRLFLESISNGYINEAKGYLVEMAKARRAIG